MGLVPSQTPTVVGPTLIGKWPMVLPTTKTSKPDSREVRRFCGDLRLDGPITVYPIV